MMMITLDNLAHRYNCLPSEALSRATTLDLMVLDISARWSNKKIAEANGKKEETITPKLSAEEMQAMIDRVRGAKQ